MPFTDRSASHIMMVKTSVITANINKEVNNEQSLYKDRVDLPTNMNGVNLRFYDLQNDFPPIPFHYLNDYYSNIISIF